jgi:hypothetical protein
MNVMVKFVAGISIGVAATGGCYAFAATVADRIAASYAPESARQARIAVPASIGPRGLQWKAIEGWAPAGARTPRAS